MTTTLKRRSAHHQPSKELKLLNRFVTELVAASYEMERLLDEVRKSLVASPCSTDIM